MGRFACKPTSTWRITLIAALAVPGCVLGGAARPSRDAVRRGPSTVDRPTAGAYLASQERHVATATATGDAPRAAGEAHWMQGHVHWAGVEYVSVPGQWERRHPGYAWSPPLTDDDPTPDRAPARSSR